MKAYFDFSIERIQEPTVCITGRCRFGDIKLTEYLRTPLDFAWAFVRGQLNQDGLYRCSVMMIEEEAQMKAIECAVTDGGTFRIDKPHGDLAALEDELAAREE